MSVSTSSANRLLSIIGDLHPALLKHATPVDLPLHTVLYEEHSVPKYAYFPLAGLASIVTMLPGGETAEVGCIGKEGLVGSSHVLGPASLPTRGIVQLPLAALRVRFADLVESFHQSAEVRSRILEFEQQQSAVFAQIAACNRLHDAEQRLARWMLMTQDRTGYDTLGFTHEYLSQMIATQRTTVTITARNLQAHDLIRYSRGKIHILDRVGLEARACVCTQVIHNLFTSLYRDGLASPAERSMKATRDGASGRLSSSNTASDRSES